VDERKKEGSVMSDNGVVVDHALAQQNQETGKRERPSFM
jgi:hypothetical protein